jgi:hypothetical protein
MAGNSPNQPRGVTIIESPAGSMSDPVEIPPLSVSLLVLVASGSP